MGDSRFHGRLHEKRMRKEGGTCFQRFKESAKALRVDLVELFTHATASVWGLRSRPAWINMISRRTAGCWSVFFADCATLHSQQSRWECSEDMGSRMGWWATSRSDSCPGCWGCVCWRLCGFSRLSGDRRRWSTVIASHKTLPPIQFYWICLTSLSAKHFLKTW